MATVNPNIPPEPGPSQTPPAPSSTRDLTAGVPEEARLSPEQQSLTAEVLSTSAASSSSSIAERTVTPSPDMPVASKVSELPPVGIVKEMKRKLGMRVPEHRLGVGVTEREVTLHREPKHADGTAFTSAEFKANGLNNTHVANRLKELTANFKASEGRDPGPREIAKLKEQATKEIYDTRLQNNIAMGLYNPRAMGAEIKKVLGVGDEIPANITDLDSAMGAIEDELKKFNIPLFEKGRKQSQVLTNELREHLTVDVRKTMKQYMKVYPGKTAEDAFVFCRDMARNAVYQVVFDKKSFSGSDHGVLHVHHNIENGDHMHTHMAEGDMTPRARLLSRVMHFYHDIGYSVGSGKDFDVMKDHPFVGAAFIEANRDYFDHYLGSEETNILRDSILYHAIVSFDSNVDDDLAMVRFTTSNSDACAVSSDQKTQSFWRENPETLLALAKLKHFLIIYPEYAGRDKLSHSDIMTKPDSVLDMSNPRDRMAFSVFSSVRQELLDIAAKRQLPEDEKQAFIQAIETNFNAFSGEVVLGQYGAELVDVSVVDNPKFGAENPTEPKYLPAVKMAPSVLYSFLESLYSTDVAGKNIQKVLQEEYYASKTAIGEALEEVGSGTADSKIVPSDVAHLELVKQTKTESSKLRPVIATLKQQNEMAIPIETRRAFNQVMNVMKDLGTGAKGLADFLGALQVFYQITGENSPLQVGLETVATDFTRNAALLDALDSDLMKMKEEDMSPEQKTEKKEILKQLNEYILEMRTQCSNEDEWVKIIGLSAAPFKQAPSTEASSS